MSGKKLIIIVAVLALASFGGTFVMTQMLQPKVEPVMTPEKLKRAEQDKTTLAGIEKTAMGDRVQLGSLIEEVKRLKVKLTRETQALAEREKRIQISAGQLQEAARELESMRLQLAAPLVKLKGLKQELEETRLKITLEETANLKNNAKTLEQMKSDKASKMLEDMCKGSQMEDAARLLHFTNDRTKGDLLSNITDTTVTAKLFDMLKKIRQEEG